MHKPWFVFEDIKKSPPRKLVALGSVDLLATRLWWLSLGWMFAFGIAAGLAFAPGSGFREKLIIGLGYGLLVSLAAATHNLGHFLGGSLVRASMTAFLLNASIPIDCYNDKDERELPSKIHLSRALGGPVFSALVGTVILYVNAMVVNNDFIHFYGVMNCFIAVGAMFPIPGIDGGILWREMRHWRSGS
jgi:hypothetical protein